MLPYLIEVALKSTIVLAVAVLVAVLLRKRSATARHLVWTIGVAGILVLPAVMPLLPVWELLPASWHLVDVVDTSQSELSKRTNEPALATSFAPADSPASRDIGKARMDRSFSRLPKTSRSVNSKQQAELSPTASVDVEPDAAAQAVSPIEVPVEADAVAAAPESGHSWQLVIRTAFFIWLAGSAVLLLRIAIGQVALWRTARSYRRIRDGHLFEQLVGVCGEMGFKHPARLFVSPGPTMPMAWGLFRSNILLPTTASTWSLPHLRSVLLHELSQLRGAIVSRSFSHKWRRPRIGSTRWCGWRRSKCASSASRRATTAPWRRARCRSIMQGT